MALFTVFCTSVGRIKNLYGDKYRRNDTVLFVYRVLRSPLSSVQEPNNIFLNNVKFIIQGDSRVISLILLIREA